MIDRNDPRGSDCLDGLRKDFSRRSFLQGVGALSIAALVPEVVFSAGLPEATEKGSSRAVPLLGALFNPYHRPADWNVLALKRPEGMPLLGSYASHTSGSAMTQIIWARTMGVRFFLASYSPARSSQNRGLDALFKAADRDGFRVGLYIDMEDNAGRPRRRPSQARLTAALQQVASRYVPHPAYLRDGFGRPVLGVAGLNGGSMLDAVLAAGDRKAWGPVFRFPASWRSVPDVETDPALAMAVDRDGVYPGFSARSGDRPMCRAIPCHSRSVSAVLVSPVRDQAKGIQLPEIATGPKGPAYVILDSFNNWGVSVPLEPGTASRTQYGKHVARWSRSQKA